MTRAQGDVAIKFEMWHRMEAAVVPLPPTPQQQVLPCPAPPCPAPPLSRHPPLPVNASSTQVEAPQPASVSAGSQRGSGAVTGVSASDTKRYTSRLRDCVCRSPASLRLGAGGSAHRVPPLPVRIPSRVAGRPGPARGRDHSTRTGHPSQPASKLHKPGGPSRPARRRQRRQRRRRGLYDLPLAMRLAMQDDGGGNGCGGC